MSREEREDGAHRIESVQGRRPEDDLEMVEAAGMQRAEAVRDLRCRPADRDAEDFGRPGDRRRLHDDPGRSPDRRWVPAYLETRGLEGGKAWAELREVAALLDEPTPDVRMRGCEAEHPGTLGADHDRDPAGPRADGPLLEIPSGMEGALEIDVAVPEQRQDDLQRLLKAPDGSILGQAKGVSLAPGVPRAEAKHEPPAADLVEGLDGLGEDPGV